MDKTVNTAATIAECLPVKIRSVAARRSQPTSGAEEAANPIVVKSRAPGADMYRDSKPWSGTLDAMPGFGAPEGGSAARLNSFDLPALVNQLRVLENAGLIEWLLRQAGSD
jgi:hypothetical protein